MLLPPTPHMQDILHAADGFSAPQRPDQHTASHVYDAACEVHHEHFSRTADKRVKDLNPISNYWTGPAWMVGLVIGSETA
jgi:hypothetical protein